MDDKYSIQKIMIFLKKKYNYINQISDYTQDIKKSLSQNDMKTVEILLGMRYKVILGIEKCNEDIENLLDSLSDLDRLRVGLQMSETSISSEVSFEEEKINELYVMTKSLLKKIIEADSIINSRLKAGLKLAAMDTV